MEESLYDTNILIEHARKPPTPLIGNTTIFNIIEFPPAAKIRGLKVIFPQPRDYENALKLSVKLLKQGKPIPTVDTLIAAICINRNLTLITRDTHFMNIRLVEEKFKVNLKPSTQP